MEPMTLQKPKIGSEEVPAGRILKKYKQGKAHLESASSTTSSSGRCATGGRWRKTDRAAIRAIRSPPAAGW